MDFSLLNKYYLSSLSLVPSLPQVLFGIGKRGEERMDGNKKERIHGCDACFYLMLQPFAWYLADPRDGVNVITKTHFL